MIRKTIFFLLLALFSLFSYAEEINKRALESWLSISQKNISSSLIKVIADQVMIEKKKKGIDPAITLGIIKAESNYRTTAKSGYGAKGLMQVVPRWHRDKIKGRNVYDPRTNIEVGTQVLYDCLNKRRGNLNAALNCYSGGAGKRYKTTIANVKKEAREHMRVYAILNRPHEPTPVYAFDDGKNIKSSNILTAFISQNDF